MTWTTVTAFMRRPPLIGRVHFERSTCYHRYTVETYQQFLLLAGRNRLPVPADLGVRYRLATQGIVERLDGDRVVERRTVATSGRVCVAVPRHDDYSVYRLRVRRGNSVRPPIEIHLKGGTRPRILGVIRVPN